MSDAQMNTLLAQIEKNTRNGGGGGAVGGAAGGDGGMCGSCPGMGMLPCGGDDDKEATAKSNATESKNSDTPAKDAGGMPAMPSMDSCACGVPNNGPTDPNAPGTCYTGGDMKEWRAKRFRYCCSMAPGGCWEGLCGSDDDPRWKSLGYYDSYIGGDQKDCVKSKDGNEVRGPWNAPNICLSSRHCMGPCKVHVRRCCCLCECNCCCSCCDCKTSTIGCQCPCTCIPEDMRCVHCTCGCFPTMCYPVVNTLCCGDWEKIQPADQNVPEHIAEPELETCCSMCPSMPGADDEKAEGV